MKYTVAKSVVYVEGYLWMGGKGNTTYNLQQTDVPKLKNDQGQITGESVRKYMKSRFGDFESITHVRASIEDGPDTVEVEWPEGKCDG